MLWDDVQSHVARGAGGLQVRWALVRALINESDVRLALRGRGRERVLGALSMFTLSPHALAVPRCVRVSTASELTTFLREVEAMSLVREIQLMEVVSRLSLRQPLPRGRQCVPESAAPPFPPPPLRSIPDHGCDWSASTTRLVP